MLIESGAVRSRGPSRRVAWLLPAAAALLLTRPGLALAQVVEVTPAFEVQPSVETTPWILWMAIGLAALGGLTLLATVAGYMRFAPKFYGREEPTKLPPGTRPPQLVRQAAAIRYAPPAEPVQAPAPAPAPAAVTAAVATEAATAPPAGERAVQADAVGQAEAAEPEARPSAKTAEETGEKAAPPGEPPAEAPSTETPAAAEPAPAPRAEAAPPAAEAAPPTAEAAPAEAPRPAAASQAGSALDQETFDRVLQEQLDKGVDRRVAEGRARAAAVVAARRKAQG